MSRKSSTSSSNLPPSKKARTSAAAAASSSSFSSSSSSSVVASLITPPRSALPSPAPTSPQVKDVHKLRGPSGSVKSMEESDNGWKHYRKRIKAGKCDGELGDLIPAPTIVNAYYNVYGNELFTSLRKSEDDFKPYLPYHKSLTESMMAILTDWLVELTTEYGLSTTTLHHAVRLVDAYLRLSGKQGTLMPRSDLQLLGCSCMLIASKLHEIHPPSPDDFEYISDHTYTRSRIIEFELEVCNVLEFRLSGVTCAEWGGHFCKVSGGSDREVLLVRYLTELCLLDLGTRAKPSLTTAGCVYLARRMEGREGWNSDLAHHAGYSKEDLREIVMKIAGIRERAEGSTLKAVWQKYKAKKYGEVSLRVGVLEEDMGF